MGVIELLRYDPAAPEGARLCVWDRLDGDLVEREVDEESTPSMVLPVVWTVAPADELSAALRIRTSSDGGLVPTRAEAQRAEAEARRAEAEARRAAEARVAELEAELKRRG
jgi:hypothetical protein